MALPSQDSRGKFLPADGSPQRRQPSDGPAPPWRWTGDQARSHTLTLRRLYFEQPNFDRTGYDFGILTPVLCVGAFYYDLVLLPYHFGTDPQNRTECSAGKCLPGDQAPFLQDNMQVEVDLVEGDVVGIHLPASVVLEVVEADPVVKGQTATSSYKPAKLSNGVKTMVPPFVEVGEKIVVRTEDASYMERFKG